MKLWKFNKITGLWDFQREVNSDTKEQWFSLFQKSEPNEFFKVSKVKPKTLPYK